MAVCGMCHGTGYFGADRCKCISVASRKAFFAKKVAKKKADDTLKSGHKHGNDKFLHETATSMWFECACGHTHKVLL